MGDTGGLEQIGPGWVGPYDVGKIVVVIIRLDLGGNDHEAHGGRDMAGACVALFEEAHEELVNSFSQGFLENR